MDRIPNSFVPLVNKIISCFFSIYKFPFFHIFRERQNFRFFAFIYCSLNLSLWEKLLKTGKWQKRMKCHNLFCQLNQKKPFCCFIHYHFTILSYLWKNDAQNFRFFAFFLFALIIWVFVKITKKQKMAKKKSQPLFFRSN